jgi:hypothetical protein
MALRRLRRCTFHHPYLGYCENQIEAALLNRNGQVSPANQASTKPLGSQMKDTIPGRRPDTSDAALRSGEVGPREAECFAYLANRIRVEFVLRSNQRHFSSSPLAVDCQSSMPLSASFVLGIEATPLFA